MTAARVLSIDAEIDRIMRLLEIGIEAARQGNADMANMAADEVLKSAGRLPDGRATLFELAEMVGETA